MSIVDPRGTVTSISDEMLDAVPELVEQGCTVRDIMSVFEISSECAESWSSAADALPSGVAWDSIPEEIQRYLHFMRVFEESMRSLKVVLFGRVYSGSSKWSSASWLLQRKFPEEYNVVAGESYEPLESRAPTAEEQKALSLMAESEGPPVVEADAEASE